MKSKSTHRGNTRIRTHWGWSIGASVAVLALAVLVYGRHGRDQVTPGLQPLHLENGKPINFSDARQRAAELIRYDRAIELSGAQRKMMDEALSSIPAPCCSQYSIAKCCCPCNLAKSAWGLSKFLIAREQANASQVHAAVNEWLEFTNPGTYTGNACFTRGCERPFEHNGCGGMDALR